MSVNHTYVYDRSSSGSGAMTATTSTTSTMRSGEPIVLDGDEDHSTLLMGMDELPDESEPNSAITVASDYPSAHTSDFVTTPADLSSASSSASFASWSASSSASASLSIPANAQRASKRSSPPYLLPSRSSANSSSSTSSSPSSTTPYTSMDAPTYSSPLACMDRWFTMRRTYCRCGGVFKGVRTSRANFVCSILTTAFLLLMLLFVLFIYVILPAIVPIALSNTQITLIGINVTSPTSDSIRLALDITMSAPSAVSSATVRAVFTEPIRVALMLSTAEHKQVVASLARSRLTSESSLVAPHELDDLGDAADGSPILLEFGTFTAPPSTVLDASSSAPFTLDAPLAITNTTAFTAFLITLLTQPTVTWHLVTRLTVTSRFLSYQLPTVTNVLFDHTTALTACNGLPGTLLLHYSLDNSTNERVLLDLTVRTFNPSVFDVTPLGTLTLALVYNNELIGTLVSESNVDFAVGPSDIPFRGYLHNITSHAQREAVGSLFSSIMGNSSVVLNANGLPENSSSIALYSPGLAPLALDVVVAPPPSMQQIILTMNVTDVTLIEPPPPNRTCTGGLFITALIIAEMLLPPTLRVQSNVTTMNMTAYMKQITDSSSPSTVTVDGRSSASSSSPPLPPPAYNIELQVVNASVVHTHNEYPRPDILNITVPMSCLGSRSLSVGGGADVDVRAMVRQVLESKSDAAGLNVDIYALANATLMLPIGEIIVRDLLTIIDNSTVPL